MFLNRELLLQFLTIFIYFWLLWVFIAAPGLSLVARSRTLVAPWLIGVFVPTPGIKPVSPASAGRFLTPGPPGKLQLASSVAQSCLTLCDPMDCSSPGFLVHHQRPELAQTHVHQVGDAIQPSNPLSSSFPPAFNLSQLQGLFQWVDPLHQVATGLELQF